MVWHLLLAYQAKHYLADYPFQTPYMLGKFKGGREWIVPLAAHASVHAAFTLGIGFAATGSYALPAWLALLDFCVHFTVDRLKASPRLGGRWKPIQREFWWALGADQMAHHLTHYFIIWRLVRGAS